MSTALPPPGPAIGMSAEDRRLAIGGGACIAATVLAVVLRLSGALPSGLATVLVLVIASAGLRLFVSYAAKSATSARRAQVTGLISQVGLAVSAATLVFSLPVVSSVGGMGPIVEDAFAHGWTLLLLTLGVGVARTLGWRTIGGTALTGFLAVPGLAAILGRPVIDRLGTDSALATALWVPLTEEVVKALPILLVVVLTARRATPRVSAVEVGLLGAWVGAGFAVYENAQFGRGALDLGAIPILSLLVPSATSASPLDNYAATGHLVWTALIGLGLGITVLYRKVDPRARLAAPLAFAVALGEHCLTNKIAGSGGDAPAWVALGRILTLNGWSSTILLIAGIAYVGRQERRAVLAEDPAPMAVQLRESVWLPPARAATRGAALARLQSGTPPAGPTPGAAPAPAPGGTFF